MTPRHGKPDDTRETCDPVPIPGVEPRIRAAGAPTKGIKDTTNDYGEPPKDSPLDPRD